ETATAILNRALRYLDRQIKADYDQLLEDEVTLNAQYISYLQVQYLYLRSFVDRPSLPKESEPAYQYYVSQAKAYWNAFNPYLKGQLALALHRGNEQS